MNHWTLVLIYHKLRHLDNFMENIMADMTNLNASVDALTTGVAATNAHMDKLFADLTAALGASDQAAVDAAATAIKAQVDALAAGVTRTTSA